ncbi:MAG: MFS transporter [Candidatus Firestonebacteria bacterium]|nr:MFS transporter [Candidatus Firestonebacteria bacterium]
MNIYNSKKEIKHIFRSLENRNYSLFFAGQSISLIGTWMTQIASSWLVYRLTNSALLLGIVGFASQFPTFLFASFAGVIADRWNRHRIMIITQLLSMIHSFILAFLVMSDIITIYQIILLNIFQGLVNAIDLPARQSFIVEMVEKKEDLANAIALNSSMFNGARLIGPSIAGILIAAYGEGLCFLIDGFSFLAVIFALSAMKIIPRKIFKNNTHVFQELKDGFNYAFSFKPIRAIILLLALVSLMGMPFTVLMPVFAKNIFHGGPHTLGFLICASGIGALAGAIYLAWRKSIIGLEKIIVLSTIIFGFSLITFSLSRFFLLSIILMLSVGFGMMVSMASCNTILQTIVDDDKRGRVMSLYTMAFMGMVPLGSLLAGVLADMIGAPNTLIIGGCCIIGGVFFFAKKLSILRDLLHPVYIKKGVIKTVEVLENV